MYSSTDHNYRLLLGMFESLKLYPQIMYSCTGHKYTVKPFSAARRGDIGSKWPKLTQKKTKMAPKGSPRYCMFMVSAIVHNIGGFRPFWVRKKDKYTPRPTFQDH